MRTPVLRRAAACPRRLLEFMFNAIDLDNSGAVSCYAFLDWLLTMTSGNPEARLQWGFNVCDIDGDGFVDKKEVRPLADACAAARSRCSGLAYNSRVALNAMQLHLDRSQRC